MCVSRVSGCVSLVCVRVSCVRMSRVEGCLVCGCGCGWACRHLTGSQEHGRVRRRVLIHVVQLEPTEGAEKVGHHRAMAKRGERGEEAGEGRGEGEGRGRGRGRREGRGKREWKKGREE